MILFVSIIMHKAEVKLETRAGALLTSALRPVSSKPIMIVADFDGTVVADHQENYLEDPQVMKLARLTSMANSANSINVATVTGGRLSRTIRWADTTGTLLLVEHGNLLYDPVRPQSERI